MPSNVSWSSLVDVQRAKDPSDSNPGRTVYLTGLGFPGARGAAYPAVIRDGHWTEVVGVPEGQELVSMLDCT